MNRTESANPFPGMNPFVESPAEWPDTHDSLVTYCRGLLNTGLPQGYRAKSNESVYIEANLQRRVRADVMVVGKPAEDVSIVQIPQDKTIDAAYHIEILGEAEPDKYVEIVRINQPDKVVCVIEFISPSNKQFGRGREEYEKKQNELLRSGTHLLEVDLIRAYPSVVAVPEADMRALLAPTHSNYDYIVCLHRAGVGVRYEVWPFTVRDRLPTVAVPLMDGEADVPLDLQTAFERAFAEGAYRDGARLYQNEPVPPLSPEDAAWADELLRTRGLR